MLIFAALVYCLVKELNLGVNKNLLRHVTGIIICKALLLMDRNALCINNIFQMFNILKNKSFGAYFIHI